MLPSSTVTRKWKKMQNKHGKRVFDQIVNEIFLRVKIWNKVVDEIIIGTNEVLQENCWYNWSERNEKSKNCTNEM